MQLLTYMYNESKAVRNLNTKRLDMRLCSSTNIKFKEKLTRKTTVLNSPLYRGYALWNDLPKDIQLIKTPHVFKNSNKSIFYN